MEYWLAFWWVFFVAVMIYVTVCTVGIEGAILFVPFFAVVFPVIRGRDISPTEAIQIGLLTEIFGFTSSFLGFFRAKLIDWRIGWFSTLTITTPSGRPSAGWAASLKEWWASGSARQG